jgi:hypothetical protein
LPLSRARSPRTRLPDNVVTSPRPPRVATADASLVDALRRGEPLPSSGAVIELTLHEFEARYRELLGAFESSIENDRCVQCEACRGCTQCTFCRHSQRLIRCHYCVECVDCSDSSHCQASRGLSSCQHCTDSRNCTRSSYLVRCSNMTGCTYCLGCVGLSQKDFHILNQPFDRATYFQITRTLLRQLQP